MELNREEQQIISQYRKYKYTDAGVVAGVHKLLDIDNVVELKQTFNIYRYNANMLRGLVSKGEADEEVTKADIKANDILAGCSSDDIEALFNTSAFNEIAISYLIYALYRLPITKEVAGDITDAYYQALDTKTVSQVYDSIKKA